MITQVPRLNSTKLRCAVTFLEQNSTRSSEEGAGMDLGFGGLVDGVDARAGIVWGAS